jgi:hypothetical protein
MIAVQDSALVGALERSMRVDVRESREITLEDVEKWSLLERARDRLAALLREQI